MGPSTRLENITGIRSLPRSALSKPNNALTIRDVDAGTKPVTVTLTANDGTLRFDDQLGEDYTTRSITDTVAGRTCPSRNLIYFDLDGNGEDGSVPCQGTGGARRIRRTPR